MKFLATLALALSISAIPLEDASSQNQDVALLKKRTTGPTVLLGYRTVREQEAKSIHDLGSEDNWHLVKPPGDAGRQTGAGSYLSQGFRQWSYLGLKTWDCAVYAEEAAWNGLNKAWLPESWDANGDGECDKPLWGMKPQQKKNRADFLKAVNPSFTPENTVLFSITTGDVKIPQLFIPEQLVTSMTFPVKCAENKEGNEANADKIAGLASQRIDWDLDNLPGRTPPAPQPPA